MEPTAASVRSLAAAGLPLLGILLLAGLDRGGWLARPYLLEDRTEVETDDLPLVGGDPHAPDWMRERGRVEVRVPWEMTRAAFLDLYHLRNRRAALEALRERGVERPDDVLEPGFTLRLPLNETREAW